MRLRSAITQLGALLQQLTGDHFFAPMALLLRLAFLSELVQRLFTRDLITHEPQRSIWIVLTILFALYVLVLGADALVERAHSAPTGLIRVQIGADLAFFSAFFILNGNPHSNLVLALLLPLMLAARYLRSWAAVGVLFSSGVLMLGSVGLIWLLQAYQGHTAHTLVMWLLSEASFGRNAPLRDWFISCALFAIVTFPVIRVSQLQRRIAAQHKQIEQQHAQTQQQHAEQRQRINLLSKAVSRLAGTRNIDAIVQEALEIGQRELNCEAISLFIFEQGRYRRHASRGLHDGYFAEESYAPGEGITGCVIAADATIGQAVRVNDVLSDPRVKQLNVARYRDVLSSRTTAHLLAVPLNGANRTFGILRAINRLQPNRQIDPEGFRLSDEHTLDMLAALLALAYSMARRIDKVQAIFQIPQQITPYHTNQQVCAAITQALRQMGYGTCRVLIIHAANQLRAHAQIGLSAQIEHLLDSLPEQQAIRTQVLAQQAIHEDRSLPDLAVPLLTAWLQSHHLAQVLRVPLHHGGQALGLIEIFVDAECQVYANEQLMLQRLATQASQALVSHELYAGKLHQMDQLRQLAAITERLLAQPDPQHLAEHLVDAGADLLGAHECTLFLLTPDQQAVILQATSCREWVQTPQLCLPLQTGLLAEIVQTQTSLRRDHTRPMPDDPLLALAADRAALPAFALLLTPIHDDRGNLLGIVRFSGKRATGREPGFSAADEQIAELVGRQFALALEKLDRIEKLHQLHRLAGEIVQMGDMQQVLQRIACGAQVAMGADLVVIAPYAAAEHRLLIDQAAYAGAQHDLHLDAQFRSTGLTQRILSDPQGYVVVEDLAQQPEWHSQISRQEAIRATLGVHLRVGETSLGVLFYDYRQPRPFDAAALSDALTFSHLAAVAINNAHMLERTQKHANELQMIQSLTRTELGGTHEIKLSNILEVVMKHVCEKIGFDFCAISLIDERNQAIASYSANGIATQWQRKARHALSSNDIQAWVVRHQQLQVIAGPDPRFDPVIYARFNHERLERVFAPISGRDQSRAIGTVEAGIERGRGRTISPEQVERLRIYIEQMALIIEIAHALDRAQQYSQQLDRLHAMAQHLVRMSGSSQTPTLTVLTEAEQLIGELFDRPHHPHHSPVVVLDVDRRVDEATLSARLRLAPAELRTLRERAQREHWAHPSAALPDASHGLDKTLACVAVQVGQRTFGYLWVRFADDQQIMVADRSLIELGAAQVAAMLTNAYGVVQLQRSYEALIHESEHLYHNFIGGGFTAVLNDIRQLQYTITTSSLSQHQQRLSDIYYELFAMRRRIDSLLKLRQSEQGSYILQRTLTDPSELVDDIVQRMGTLAAVKQISIKLRKIMPDDGADLLIFIDSDRIGDVVRELIYNAIKYTPKQGNITVQLLRDEHWCQISVHNTGPGIDTDYQEGIFQKRVRHLTPEGHAEHGYGMGLYFARHMVELHNGQLTLTSSPDAGTEFRVCLPGQVQAAWATMRDRTEDIYALRHMQRGHPFLLWQHETAIAPLVEAAVATFAAMAPLRQSRILLDMPPDDGQTALFIDVRRLQAALEELICNALKFAPFSSTITLQVRCVAQMLLITLRNPGTPLSEADRHLLTDREIDLRDPAKISTGAIRLGLYFAATVIRAHGGSIAFDADAGHVICTVMLPCTRPALHTDEEVAHDQTANLDRRR
jgi:signal transduction histidine kinase